MAQDTRVPGLDLIEPVSALAGRTAPPTPPALARPAGPALGPGGWARANLFSGWLSTAVTLLLGYFLLRWAWEFFGWGVLHAVWSVPDGAHGPDAAGGRHWARSAACWGHIGDKSRFILFGPFPYHEQWRPLICIGLFIGLYVASAMRRFWRRELLYIWVATLVVIGVLMWGGVLGLPFVSQD